MLVHCRVTPSTFAGTPICTPGWREALWEKSVLPKNTTQWPRPGLEPWPPSPESSTLTMRPPCLPEDLLKKSNGLELSDKSSKNGNPLPHIINKKTKTRSLPMGHIDNIILQLHCIAFAWVISQHNPCIGEPPLPLPTSANLIRAN